LIGIYNTGIKSRERDLGTPKVKSRKKRQKCVMLRRNRVKLVLGEDILMDQVLEMDSKSLTGWFYKRQIVVKKLEQWIARVWRPPLGYSERFHILFKGWLGFIFRSEEDVVKILSMRGF
jgi:hypothetical protein